MIRFVIVHPEGSFNKGPMFWSGKSAHWVDSINLATRYKKREEAEKLAFKMAVKSGLVHEISIDPASKYEGGMLYTIWYPGDKCHECGESAGLRDTYTCNRTCLGHRPQKHRHGTCRNCGYAALLFPIVRLIR